MPAPIKKFNFVFSAKSDTGLVRTENQDNFGKFPDDNSDLDAGKGQLFIVADGMGGHKGGKEASSIAVKTVSTEFFKSPYEEAVALKEAIEKANSTIFNKSGDKTEFGRMGTTCTVLSLKGDSGVIGHVGDSRIYKIENNRIEQLTNDHTRVQEMLREGLLTPEEAMNYPSKSVLARALGVDENIKVDIIEDIKLKRGQSFVLCSDGLAKVSKGEILNIVLNNKPSDACNMLVDLANERGGKDNVTVLIIKIDPEQEVKIPVSKPVRKKIRKPRKNRIGWSSVIIVFAIIIVLLFIEYQNSFRSSSPVRIVKRTPAGQIQESGNNPETDINPENSDRKLLDEAAGSLKEKDYEKAYRIYKSLLGSQSLHQEASNGIDEIASAYLSIAEKLMNDKNFEEALKYYKKADAVKPGDEKIKSLMNLCSVQINNKVQETESAPEKNSTPGKNETASKFTVSKFDLPGWNYPAMSKNECSISSNEIDFTNTISDRFIIYNQDLFDVTLSLNAQIVNPNSVLGLIIGYVSPLDYYIFRYRDGGSYMLQRIKGNEIEKLLDVQPRETSKSDTRKMEVIYSNNLIKIYDQTGLIGSYRSVWGIFGKAGIYAGKNSSVTFKDIHISGSTKLD